MENSNFNRSEIFSLEIDERAKTTFLEMARWTKFLAILGYIFLGLMVLAGLGLAMVAGTVSEMANNPLAGVGAAGMIIMFLVVVGLYFYPIYALMKYSSSMKSAMVTGSKEQFNTAVMYLKNMFKYMGILMIIVLCIYGIAIIFGVIGGLMATR